MPLQERERWRRDKQRKKGQACLVNTKGKRVKVCESFRSERTTKRTTRTTSVLLSCGQI